MKKVITKKDVQKLIDWEPGKGFTPAEEKAINDAIAKEKAKRKRKDAA